MLHNRKISSLQVQNCVIKGLISKQLELNLCSESKFEI